MQIILLSFLILIAFFYNKFIRINSIILYVLSLFLAGASILVDSNLFTIITSGNLGLSFYFIVMLTGVLKSGSEIKNRLNSVRKDYAIMGFIFISPHVYLRIIDSISSDIPLQLFGFTAFILIIPLFITSFNLVKNKIPTSIWLNLHKMAYLFYFILFLHIISIGTNYNIVMYYLIFAVYTFFALIKRMTHYRYLKAITITILIGTTSLIFFNNIFNYIDKPTDIIQGNNFEDGIYIGYSKGYQNIDTIVRVSIQNNIIEYVIVEECGCTSYLDDGYYSNISYKIANDIRTQNRTNIDSISGATQSSVAINKSVSNALQAALIE